MMKKTHIGLFLAGIVLLGLVIYMIFFAPGSGKFNQVFSDECCTQQEVQLGQTDAIGSVMMGSGMMHTTGSFINNEYEFLVHMIPHHKEAILTAQILKDNTEREEMKLFAETIISTQSAEIEQMVTWLETWYPEKEHEIDYQPMMRDLTGLKGNELDKVFLEDMIPHHMEAVMMSQQLLSRRLAEHQEVALLARNIRNNQHDEIHMMSGMLSKWYGNESKYSPTLIWVGLIALAVIILISIWLISILSKSISKGSSGGSAKELLDIRYAKGEISQEEYRNTRKNL